MQQNRVAVYPNARAIVIKIFGEDIYLPLYLLNRVLYGFRINIPGIGHFVFLPLEVVFASDNATDLVFYLNNKYTIAVYHNVIKLGWFAVVGYAHIREKQIFIMKHLSNDVGRSLFTFLSGTAISRLKNGVGEISVFAYRGDNDYEDNNKGDYRRVHYEFHLYDLLSVNHRHMLSLAIATLRAKDR